MPSQGYTVASFKRSAHDYEKELAVMTEEYYSRLRKQGKKLRSAARKIRSIEIFTPPSLEDIER